MRIRVKVVKYNQYEFPTGCVKDIQCPVEAKGTYWFTPQYNADGSWASWLQTVATNNTPPTTDSTKIAKVYVGTDVIDIAIGDAETVTIVTDGCDLCCGGTPVDLSSRVVKTPIDEALPCTDANGDRVIYIAYPAAGPYIVAATFNGVNASPAPAASYANPTTLFTYIGTTMIGTNAYGTATHNVADGVITFKLGPLYTSGKIKVTA